MIGQYVGECLLKPVIDRSPWWRKIIWPPIVFEVAETFEFHSDYGVVVIEKGFLTDGASVPRPVRWLFPPSGNYLRAAIVHDAAIQQMPWDVAADVFLDAMVADKVNSFVAGVLYMSVMVFGRMKGIVERIKR